MVIENGVLKNAYWDVPQGGVVISPKGVKEIGADAYCGGLSLGTLRNIILTEEVGKIGIAAFRDCRSLSSINAEGVKEVESSAFEGCNGLYSLYLGNVKTIGPMAFAYCKNLRSVVLPKVEELGRLAFANCDNLNTVYLSPELKTIGDWAFNYCKNLEKIYLPASAKFFKTKVFQGCSKKKLQIIHYDENE